MRASRFFSSILASNAKKDFLDSAYMPATVTAFEFGLTSLLTLFWLQRSGAAPSMDDIVWMAIVPLSLTQVFCHYFTAYSVARVPVAYTHTVKAMSPIFTVVLSRALLGERHSARIYACLGLIAFGVSLSSVTQLTFETGGFTSAVAASLGGVLQSLYSKHMLVTHTASAELLLLASSLLSAAMLLPFVLYEDAGHVRELLAPLSLWRLVLSGTMAFGQSITAFTLIDMVSPLSYSISSTFKRLAIILASVLYFKSPMSTLNALGVLLAFSGQFGYVWIKAQASSGKHSSSSSNAGHGSVVQVGV